MNARCTEVWSHLANQNLDISFMKSIVYFKAEMLEKIVYLVDAFTKITSEQIAKVCQVLNILLLD